MFLPYMPAQKFIIIIIKSAEMLYSLYMALLMRKINIGNTAGCSN